MKKALPLIALLLIGVMSFAGCGGGEEESGSAAGSATESSQVAVVDEDFTLAGLTQIDVWPMYNALKTGEAEKYGFGGIDDKAIKTFDSGMEIVEGIPAKAFQIGDVGALPAFMAVLRFDAEIVGIACDESAANAIVARPDHPVFNSLNPQYSNVYGTAETVRGATILTTTVSSSGYTLVRWLDSMGLSDSDVTVKTLEQQTAIQAFEAGEGDFLVLWAPNLYRAYDKGFKDVATAKDVGANAPMVYVVPKEWASENGDVIARFLAMTSAQVYDYKVKGEALIPDIQTFFKDYAGFDMTEENVKRDMDRHDFFTIEEQLILMENGTLERWLDETAKAITERERIKPEELKELQEKHYNINNSYLLAAKDITPE